MRGYIKSQQLPVYQQREYILHTLKTHQVIIVESPTGSGKTTQLPIILHEAGYDRNGIIGITQPRRIAAVGISDYIQRQFSGADGGGDADGNGSSQISADLAAYKIRFADTTSPHTRIKIMTDGILLQEIKADPLLRNYSILMIDEAHERSLNIDFILGLLKQILENRPKLKIIISSATIKTEIFSRYFNNAPIVRIKTQTFPINMTYAPPRNPGDPESLIERIVGIVAGKISDYDGGSNGSAEDQNDEHAGKDILVFLSGEKLIKDCVHALSSEPFHRRLHIIPLYARLSKEEQDRVFLPPPPGKIKVVIATNIAETSITIDGVHTVIDSGLAKINYYNSRTYTSSLIEKNISQASADQRRGRAGRTGPGDCYRLYRHGALKEPFTQEEIYRTDLSEVVLRMAGLRIRNFENFDFISSPGKEAIESATRTLIHLDALNSDKSLSSIGAQMSIFPLIPRHSRIIVEAMRNYPEVLNEVIIAVCFLSTNSPLRLPHGEENAAREAHRRFHDPAGDFVSYLHIFQKFRTAKKRESFCTTAYLDFQVMSEIVNVKQQLSEIVEEMGARVGADSSAGSAERAGAGWLRGELLAAFMCSIAKGLIQFICIRTGRTSYHSLTAERIEIHPGSAMFRDAPDFLVAGEIVKTTRTFARSVSPLNRDWFSRISPEILSLLRTQKKENKHTSSRKRSGKHSGGRSGKHSETRSRSRGHSGGRSRRRSGGRSR
ncbi:MAG: helicase-related protein [Salinispira sp.]